MRRVNKNLCPTTMIASIMAANMWKNSLKNVESDNNKILYETLLDFFFTAKRYVLSEYASYSFNRTPCCYVTWDSTTKLTEPLPSEKFHQHATLPALSRRYVPEGRGQGRIVDTCIQLTATESSRNPSPNTPKCNRPQHDRPAQQILPRYCTYKQRLRPRQHWGQNRRNTANQYLTGPTSPDTCGYI